MGDGKTLLVVARTDADGTCAVASPAPSRYVEYTFVTSTDRAKTWSTPMAVKGAGCVRPRLLQVRGDSLARNLPPGLAPDLARACCSFPCFLVCSCGVGGRRCCQGGGSAQRR